MGLQAFLRSGNIIPSHELKKLIDILGKMFTDAHTKVRLFAVINVNDTSADDLCCPVAGFQFVSGCVDRFDRDSQGRHARKLVLPDESFAQ